MYVLPDRMLESFEAFQMRRQCPFHGVIQRFFNRLFETGIRQYWEEILEGPEDEPYLYNDSALSFEDVKGLFYVLLAGLGIGCLFFALELLCFNYHRLNLLFWNKLRRTKNRISTKNP